MLRKRDNIIYAMYFMVQIIVSIRYTLFKEKSERIIYRPYEHLPVRGGEMSGRLGTHLDLLSIPQSGENVKSFRWDHRLQFR